ncbi:MAG: CopG family transcriptional regulator [Pseudomonadota bacterium]
MKKRTQRDENQPVGKLTIVEDFLPPPEKLVAASERVKVTIAVDSTTIRFFKAAAKKAGSKYQRMIREVLNGYARRYA